MIRSAADLPQTLAGQGAIGIDLETCDPDLKTRGPGPHRGSFICGVSIATRAGFSAYLPVAHEVGPNLDKRRVLAWLGKQLKIPVPKVGARLVYDLTFLIREGVPFVGPFYDVQVAEPLLDENKFVYSLESIAKQYLHEGKQSEEMDAWLVEKFGKKNPRNNIWRAPGDLVARYAMPDSTQPLRIFFNHQKPELERQGLWELFLMESKLTELLARMYLRGVRVDLDAAEQLRAKFTAEKEDLLAGIKHDTGVEVNVWAARSLAQVFDHLGIRYPLTAKTRAPSFQAPWLEALDDPIGEQIRRVRWLDKMCGTFLDGCILESHHRGRVHAQFNQLKSDEGGAVTGRFSCLAGWVPVVTRRGEIPIRDVLVGDEVWTHRGRWRGVTHTWIKGREQMLDVYLSSGETLTCTREHRLLLSSGEWSTVGAIYEHIQELGRRPEERSGGTEASATTGHAHEGDHQEVTNTVAQRVGGPQGAPNREGTKGLDISAPLLLQAGCEEPYEGEVRRGAPQLEGSLYRQERLLDLQALRTKESSPPQLRGVRDLRDQAVTEGVGGPPHRRGPGEQRFKQHRDHDAKGAQKSTLVPEERPGMVAVQEIKARGDHPVYDISVEEDESYLSLGVFSHNSKQPNMQFIPTRTEESKLIRAIFLPDEGQEWWKTDYCVSPDTRILTTDLRHIRADEVRPGDELVGFDEDRDLSKRGTGKGKHIRRKLRITKVLHTKRLRRPCLFVETTTGSFTCSVEHRWLATNSQSWSYRWTRTDQLRVGSRIQWFCDVWDTDESREAGWIAGLMDGEGSVGAQSHLGIGQNVGPVLDRAKSWFRSNGYQWIERIVQNKNNVLEILLFSGGRRASWRFLGTTRPTRLLPKIREKHIEGRSIHSRTATAGTVTSITPVGEQEVIAIQTEHGTMIANGFCSHNSQIEYRLIAHDAHNGGYRGADRVVQMYRDDPHTDFHEAIAVMLGWSGKEGRSRAKTINFGLAYGEGVAKLAKQLGVSVARAEEILGEYHGRAPFIKPLARMFMDVASREGEVRTLFNRKRRFNMWVKDVRDPASGERKPLILPHRFPGSKRAFTHKALNARIQGGAADIMKLAMVDAAESGVVEVLGVPQLTVHDELDGSKPRTKIAAEALQELRRIMEGVLELSVPLVVDVEVGRNWGQTEKVPPPRPTRVKRTKEETRA